MAHLVIVRGLPSSGKSTFAKKNYPTYEHLETDALFYVNGEYKFDPKMLGAYHTAVQAQAKVLLNQGTDVVVSNTFSRIWEMQPYLDMADEPTVYMMEPILLEDDWGVYVDFKTMAEINAHGVPETVIRNMYVRWEKYKGELYVSR